MSWLSRSLATSLRIDEEVRGADGDGDGDGDGDEGEEDNLDNHAVSVDDNNNLQSSTLRQDSHGNTHFSESPSEEESHARGVKDDLTELRQTFSRQLWGMANFLAPPPDAIAREEGSSFVLSESGLDQYRPSDRSESGIRCDSPEIVDRVKGWNTETTDVAMDSYSLGSEGNDGENQVNDQEDGDEFEEEEETDEEEMIDAVGVTDEVLAFARNIAMHPETWLDFPLDPEEDLDDFIMSDAQRGHAQAVERLAPRLAALRIELCPCHMSVGYFWKVYFVLLHSRLYKHDAEILSSSQVVDARALWMKELHKQTQPETDWFGRSVSSIKASKEIQVEDDIPSSSTYYAPPEFLSPRIYAFEPPSIMTHEYETAKHMSEEQFVDKAVIEVEPVSTRDKKEAQPLTYDDNDDDDDWPEEDGCSYGGCTRVPMYTVNEEDVSFSDLEGDDDISSLALKSKMISKSTESETS